MLAAEGGIDPNMTLFISVLGGLILAALVYGSSRLGRINRTSDRIESDVLPHFSPPKPGERDNSLPARMQRTEDAVADAKLQLQRQTETDHRLDELGTKVHAMGIDLESVRKDVSAAMAKRRTDP